MSFCAAEWMLKKDKTAASSRGGKQKLNFFIRRKLGMTLPDRSKLKLKSEKVRMDLIDGCLGHLKGIKKGRIAATFKSWLGREPNGQTNRLIICLYLSRINTVFGS